MLFAALAANTIITLYPGFDDPSARVEAFTDKGPIYELIVACPVGSTIISYSKAERLFCGPGGPCRHALESKARDACGRR